MYVKLRFHHGEKLQQKPRIKYHGGIVIDYFDIDRDNFLTFSLLIIWKELDIIVSYVLFISDILKESI